MAAAGSGAVKSVCTGVERTVYWSEGKLFMIDQQALPGEFKIVSAATQAEVIKCIKDMTVRGAPAIGVAGAFGIVLTANASLASTPAELAAVVREAKVALDASRPTAVNLMWATARIQEVSDALAALPGVTVAAMKEKIEADALALAEEDVAINFSIATHGKGVVKQGANILHHCNTGALATIDYGTALGVIYECHKRDVAAGTDIHVWVDETRPRLQGSKLTAWELMRGGVPMHLIADNAAGLLMLQGKVDIVLFGADRVASNGDVANKVGTYKLCVVAKENGIPAYACVPTSTIDLTMLSGAEIHIEERSASEVTEVGSERVAPLGVPVFNPAFDVTPAKYITGIITEEGICYPPYSVSLRRAKEAAEARIAAQRAEKLKVLAASMAAGSDGAAVAGGAGATAGKA